MNVGFIGLGSMGKGIAANLLKAGHQVRVWNRSKHAVTELIANGASEATTPDEAFSGDAVLSMLADDEAYKKVFLASGLLEKTQARPIHVNMATVSAAFAADFSRLHADRGIAYVAAPVFGRTEVAVAGKLNVLAAGPPAAIDLVQPLFDAIGQKTWRVGENPVHANVIKIAGNFLIACAIEAMGESMGMAERYGIAPQTIFEIMTNTLLSSPVYKTYGSLIVDRKYEPAAFRLRLGLKDVRLALAAGEAANLPLPFGSILRDHLLEAIGNGDGDRDWSALAEVTRRRGSTLATGD